MNISFRGRVYDLHPDLVVAGWMFIAFAFAWASNMLGLELLGAVLALVAALFMFLLYLRLLRRLVSLFTGSGKRSGDQ